MLIENSRCAASPTQANRPDVVRFVAHGRFEKRTPVLALRNNSNLAYLYRTSNDLCASDATVHDGLFVALNSRHNSVS